MTRSALTDKPATLRQWLLQSLSWTALGFGLVVAGWSACLLAGGREQLSEAGWGLLLLLLHLGASLVLVRQLSTFPALKSAAPDGAWLATLAALVRGLLLLLTGLWMLSNLLLVLVLLLVVADDGRPFLQF